MSREEDSLESWARTNEIEQLKRDLDDAVGDWRSHSSQEQDEKALQKYHAIVDRLYQLGWDDTLEYQLELPHHLMPEEYQKRHPKPERPERWYSIWEGSQEMPVAEAVYEQPLPVEAGAGSHCVLSIPMGFDPTSPSPLILTLHDNWDHANAVPLFYAERLVGDLVRPGLRRLHPIVAAPDCPSQDWAAPQAEELILALVAYLQTVYRIVPGQVLVTGFGLGGAGAWHVAAQYPSLFSAAIPIAGWPPEGIVEALNIPLYAINSRDDQMVPLGPTEVAVQQLRARGILAEFVAVDGVIRRDHAWVDGIYSEITIVDKVDHKDYLFSVPLSRAVPWVQSIWNR